MGSSSNKSLGWVATARPSSKMRCSPCESSLAGSCARSCKPNSCNTAMACAVKVFSDCTGRQKEKLLPLRACTDSATLSSTVKDLNKRVI